MNLGLQRIRIAIEMLNYEQVLKVGLLFFALVAIFGVFAGSNEPVVWFLEGTTLEPLLNELHIGNSIVFNLSVGYLVSTFFWLLVVYFPERRRKTILRNNLSRRYQSFKEDTIQILLSCAINTYDFELVKELCDHRRFRAFFDEKNKERWYSALNGLEENTDRINDLLLELEMLAREVAYILDNVSIQDPKVHDFFKRLNEHIYRLKNASVYSGEQVKYLSSFLWEIHACWNRIDGQQDKDNIREMIDTL
ncbi:MAG: MnhB domain-containing protein [Nitrospira sp.]|nr:MnhB domain-containing protein [Nitrospira sp.]